MMEILNWILAAFSALCGGSTIITLFVYRKQQTRFKPAEAFEKEVLALKATVELMQGQIQFCNERMAELQKLVVDKDAYINQITLDKHMVEVKHAKNKSAINKAYECEHCKDVSNCPVLKQRAANEEAYLKQLQNEKQ